MGLPDPKRFGRHYQSQRFDVGWFPGMSRMNPRRRPSRICRIVFRRKSLVPRGLKRASPQSMPPKPPFCVLYAELYDIPIPKYSQDELTHYSAEPMYKERYNDQWHPSLLESGAGVKAKAKQTIMDEDRQRRLELLQIKTLKFGLLNRTSSSIPGNNTT